MALKSALTFKWNENILPYYAFGWEDEYTNLSDIDSIIGMVKNISKQHEKVIIHCQAQIKKKF